MDYLGEKIAWSKTADPNYSYIAEIDGEKCVIRLNDFPDEHLYTLIVNDTEVYDFDDWSAQWTRP